MKRYTLVSFLLRGGIAFSFIYAAIQSFLNPSSWVGFFPVWAQTFAEQSVGIENMLIAFSVFEVILAVWVLSGWLKLYSGLLSAAMIAGILVTNIGAFDILFRDVPIFFSALAYAFFPRRRN